MDLPMLHLNLPNLSSTRTGTDVDLKTICIIGAGPAGLVALKSILDSPQYKAGQWVPTVFEARERIGGVWLPAPPIGEPPLTPMYDSLCTNLPHPVMAFTSHSFPPSTPLYPHANVVLKYLEDFADKFILHPHIQFNTTVASVTRDSSQWNVRLSTRNTLSFDLVIVCNGHYRKPRYPDTPGIAQWLLSGRASHSMWYRRPQNFGDTVLVVGAGPSGTDISGEMRTAARIVIHSVTGAEPQDIGNLKKRGRVVSFHDDGQVTFEGGITESGISHCILATGYETSFPFLSSDVINLEIPPPVPPLPKELYNSTFGVFPLAKYVFPLQSTFPPSTLVFLGLLMSVAPFPLVEAQARAVLHVFANPSSLDPMQEAVDVMTRYEELNGRVGDGPGAIAKAWYRFQPMEQFDYRDAIHEFCSLVERDLHVAWNGRGMINTVYEKVPKWTREAYDKNILLRKAWKNLEARGEAEEWVKGVGEGGAHEWVELLKKLAKWAEDQEPDVQDVDAPKL